MNDGMDIVDESTSSSSMMDAKYTNVTYKKVEGSLTLTHSSISFVPVNGTNGNQNGSSTTFQFPWSVISKHQVSPASHPKALLRLLMIDGRPNTLQFKNRNDLERIRRDLSVRLQKCRSSSSHLTTNLSGKKRPYSEFAMSSPVHSSSTLTAAQATSFGEMDPASLAVTRSTVLAANPQLRAQHHYLVEESKTVSEEDFWKTHNDLIEEEYARISGLTRAGTSSLLQSHLQILTGRVTLGVEEMRQIFILYPAVHKAYEEKVPLEHSDEQFWRKYLESEYFHRDRGRLGAASRYAADGSGGKGNSGGAKGKKGGMTQDEQEARAAAVGTDDLFSRYDQKLREEKSDHDDSRKWGPHLAVGQFDLASTFETERGRLLEGPKDNHPLNTSDDGKGSRVIQKYNRHWAMVLHPQDAVAGSDLLQVARRSVTLAIPNDSDAKAGGGTDAAMRQLVDFASASSSDANHAHGKGASDLDEYEELKLKNTDVYYQSQTAAGSAANDDAMRKRHSVFAQSMVTKVNSVATQIRNGTKTKETNPRKVQRQILEDTFPPPLLGKELLLRLTQRMSADSKTDADALEVVSSLPEDFKKRLHTYFRRSSELLRHFFGLRRLADTSSSQQTNQKLQRIVQVMETVYREMEGIRKGLETTETGEIMRKMCLQIMDQLDWAFKLHREGSGGGGGGGFVTIEEF